MAFTVKDFWEYPQSSSTDEDMLFLVAIPSGGGNYILRNMTKADLMGAQTLVYNASATTASSYVAPNAEQSILRLTTSPGTIAEAAITFPTTPKNGWTFELTVKGTITVLIPISGINSVEDFPETISNGGAKWVYNEQAETWLLMKNVLSTEEFNHPISVTEEGETTTIYSNHIDIPDQVTGQMNRITIENGAIVVTPV